MADNGDVLSSSLSQVQKEQKEHHFEDAKETKSGDQDDDDAREASSNAATATAMWLRQHAKEFMDEWTRSGLSRHVDLPMICVVGDTSSGKSSLLSSLVGLELPSASTLTTKCPVLIQLQQADTEKARVDIQWHQKKETIQSSSPRERKRIIEQRIEIGHRSLQSDRLGDDHSEESFIRQPLSPPSSPPPPPPPRWDPRTITQNLQKEVPHCILKAQETILAYRETTVAPDVICVTLWTPNCREELTLVDLPGIVSFQHQHDSSLLSQVETLLLEYVQNPRSILVPVTAAPTNVHNSKVLQWARDVDPSTARTIPVLTKPDLMDPGSEADVVELIQSSSTFQHGYHMVMNRGQALLDNGTSISKGLELEEEYFTTNVPWNCVQENRLGIPALRSKLAKVLCQVMQETMPDIMKEMEVKYEETRTQLNEMGTIFHTRADQRKFYHGLSQELVTQVASSLSGKGGTLRRKRTSAPVSPAKIQANNRTTMRFHRSRKETSGGASRLHSACHEFLQEIQSSALATINKLVEGSHVLVSSPGITQDDVRGEIIHMSPTGLYACVDFVDEKDHTTEVLFDGIDYVATEPDFEEDEVWSEDGTRVFVGRPGGRFDSLRKIPCSWIRTDPTWLQDKMDLYRTDDLVCFVNVEMFQNIVAEFVHEDWVPPCNKLVDTLEGILKETLNQSLQDQLAATKRFPLLNKMLESTCHRVARDLIEI